MGQGNYHERHPHVGRLIESDPNIDRRIGNHTGIRRFQGGDYVYICSGNTGYTK